MKTNLNVRGNVTPVNIKRKYRPYERQKALWGFIYILPWLIGFISFFVIPLVNSFRYSLSKVEVKEGGGLSIIFVGLNNYIEAFTVHTSFNRTLVESITNMAVNVPLIVVFSLFVAVILNQKFKGRTFARAVFFLPVILASGIIANLESSSLIEAIQAERAGSRFLNILTSFELERMMLGMGVDETIVGYLTGAVDRIYEIISQSGVQILIFLAGIQSIPPQMYEVAIIEGSTGYEAFWKITFPMVSPLILVNVIYTIIDHFSSNAMTDLIRETALKSFNFGLGSAMAWVYFVAISIILIVCSYLISKRVFYQE
ncbi:ABC-type sugar transport system permease subunit [Caldicoprobacter guelmensis]|uniref:carbohydrate ABC transporter permease n=1 Tax=Caldicoprobacter guelmensis TaxID=1170224 RepID=UPI00195CF6A5|nr:sugar ABC transporter permease [Caldicoprobacter guelmensis]MBM7582107.1 ABC-type sugar transport system permease subunit [Caldicoprobacter guelmensis]